MPIANSPILQDKTAYGKGPADETEKNMYAVGLGEAMGEPDAAAEKDDPAVRPRGRR